MASSPVTTADFYRVEWKVRPSMSSSLAQFFKDQVFTDMTIFCEGKKIHCHKIVLAACSPLLEKMLRTCNVTGTKTFFQGIKFRQIQSLLEFMYKGEAVVRPEDVGEFLRAANALQVNGLSAENWMTSEAPSAHKTLSHKNHRRLRKPINGVGKELKQKKMQTRAGGPRRLLLPGYGYKNYSKEDMESAIRAISNGMSVAVASRESGVPSRTLYGRIARLGIKPTCPRTLSWRGKRNRASTITESSVTDEGQRAQSTRRCAVMRF
ncbi:unnamed protein product [Orchesella dallaii]|uniref:BTB domain-containing protein n=1 Tax=Orchesella dallaii TaxID=48710 RepID=A0ABP1RHN7_9HEXA